MKTEITDHAGPADIFNPTKVCELRLAGASGVARWRESKKDYVLSNGSYSFSLALHSSVLFSPSLPL